MCFILSNHICFLLFRYSIRLGRSKDVRGPFVDKDGKALLDGGGTIMYGSNHGQVYAPGGVGVLVGDGKTPDILYYHYCMFSMFECYAGRILTVHGDYSEYISWV